MGNQLLDHERCSIEPRRGGLHVLSRVGTLSVCAIAANRGLNPWREVNPITRERRAGVRRAGIR